MSRKMLRTNIPALIRKKEEDLKLNRRLTQKEIAKALGVTAHTFGRWMRGEVTQFNKEQLEQFMNYFDCSVSDLLIEETVEDDARLN